MTALAIIAVAAVGVGVLAAYLLGRWVYRQGVDDGWVEGHRKGFAAGKVAGFDDAYAELKGLAIRGTVDEE